MKTLPPILGVALALVFGAAGALKLADPFTFSREIEHYHLLVAPWTGVLAVYLPWLELFTAVVLLFPRWRLGAAIVALGLSLMFAAALASAAARGLDVRCGCFGTADPTAVVGALVRTVGVALLAALLVWLDRRDGQMDVQRDQPTPPPSAASNL